MHSPPQSATMSPSQYNIDALIQAQYDVLTPLLSPSNSPHTNQLNPLEPISYFSLSDSPFPIQIPPPSNPGQTLANLPSVTSSNMKRKRKDKTLAEKRVQTLIQQQYSRPIAAGVKRKRPEDIERTGRSQASPLSSALTDNLIPTDSPPSYLPRSPRLRPQRVPDDNLDWSLDDLHSALPTIPDRNKGKQRAPHAPQPTIQTDPSESWESASSIHTGSSSASIRSSSVREGSIVSTASRDRMYEDGACKIWYRDGTRLAQLSVSHIEVVRASAPPSAGSSNDSISIYARMSDSTNNIIRDDLWIAKIGKNAAPFFENAEIVDVMRSTLDKTIACVVKFAPNPADHPQYSFKSLQDGWEFMQYVAGKTLCCSVNVATIKSACTHGNSVESGTETIQIWENSPDDADGPVGNRPRSRMVKFFRNKNPTVQQQVIEFDCNTLRPPDVEARSGKVSFRFRDVREGVIKDMKYLKIIFTGEEDRIDFLHEVGFSEHIES
jgi:hypothetical protein